MLQLLDLLVELLNEIALSFDSDYYEWSSLTHLCRICQKRRDIVQPILFRKLDLRGKYKERTFTTQYLTLTYAIVRRPDLAQSVRILDMCIGKRLIPEGWDMSELQTAGLQYFTDMNEMGIHASLGRPLVE